MDRRHLTLHIKEVLGKYYSQPKVKYGIDNYLKDGYTIEQICGAFDYFYNEQNGNPAKSKGGIAILQYIFPEYLAKIEEETLAQEQARNLANAWAGYQKLGEKVVTITVPTSKPRKENSFHLK